jgi:Na+-transporting NADH:ubiquinone oxidoreductase subunit NqrE
LGGSRVGGNLVNIQFRLVGNNNYIKAIVRPHSALSLGTDLGYTSVYAHIQVIAAVVRHDGIQQFTDHFVFGRYFADGLFDVGRKWRHSWRLTGDYDSSDLGPKA